MLTYASCTWCSTCSMTNYRTLDWLVCTRKLSLTAPERCLFPPCPSADRCQSGLSCVFRGLPSTTTVEVPRSGTGYVRPSLQGVCTAACACTAAADTTQVCGNNGLTYQNSCFAQCDGQQVRTLSCAWITLNMF